jgi:hypothetical protein
MMEIITRDTRRYIPENGILYSHRRENLKSCIDFIQVPHLRFSPPQVSAERKAAKGPRTKMAIFQEMTGTFFLFNLIHLWGSSS